MNAVAIVAFRSADWKSVIPNLLLFTHGIIARYRWRGLRVRTSEQTELTVEGTGAGEFIDFAVEKLIKGTRSYRQDLTVEENIKRTVESDIFNFHKKARRSPLADRTLAQVLDGEDDPIDSACDPQQGDHMPEAADLRERQKQMLTEFSESVSDDDELSLLLLSFEDGKYKPSEIEAATGIPASRVSELKRKLSSRAEKFLLNHDQYADLKPLKEVP